MKIRATLLRSALTNPTEGVWSLMGGHKTQTEEMLLGSMAHAALLESGELDQRYVSYDGTKAGKEYKAKKLEYRDTEVVLVQRSLKEKAEQMANIAKEYLESDKCPRDLNSLFLKGKKEETLSRNEGDDLYVIKPDIYNAHCFMDYKTTSELHVSRPLWHEHCRVYATDVQLGFYYRVLKDLGFPMDKGAYHLVQSSVPPHCITTFFFPETCLIGSQERVDTALVALKYLSSQLGQMQLIEEFNYDAPLDYSLIRGVRNY